MVSLTSLRADVNSRPAKPGVPRPILAGIRPS